MRNWRTSSARERCGVAIYTSGYLHPVSCFFSERRNEDDIPEKKLISLMVSHRGW